MLVFFLFLTSCVTVYAVNGKKQVRLRITDNATSVFDETNIYLDLGTTPNYAHTEDGLKVIDTLLSAPLIYSLTADSVFCFANSFGEFNHSLIIGIGFSVQGGSTYTISSSLLDNFESTSIILLEDRETGVFTNLRVNSYNISVAQQQNNSSRFYLHVFYPAAIGSTIAMCSNNDGQILISQDTSIVWNTVILFDNNLSVVSSLSNVTGSFGFTNLQAGSYKVAFAFDIYTALVDVSVSGNQASVDVSASVLQAAPYQTIVFTANASNTDSYEWDMGDQSYITGVASPDYYYTQPGIYQVVLRGSNSYGCEAFDTVIIVVEEALSIEEQQENPLILFVGNKTLHLVYRSGISENARIEIFSSTGQQIINSQLVNSSASIHLQNFSTGIYFLRVYSGSVVTTQSFFLQ